MTRANFYPTQKIAYLSDLETAPRPLIMQIKQYFPILQIGYLQNANIIICILQRHACEN
tara:strand:- start:199 stop:375 length:177 start_codon:yes stop_codon:yes gene_type:complete